MSDGSMLVKPGTSVVVLVVERFELGVVKVVLLLVVLVALVLVVFADVVLLLAAGVFVLAGVVLVVLVVLVAFLASASALRFAAWLLIDGLGIGQNIFRVD